MDQGQSEFAVSRLKAEVKRLRDELASRERTIRELMVQVETLQRAEEAHIARNPWKRRAPKTHGSPEDY